MEKNDQIFPFPFFRKISLNSMVISTNLTSICYIKLLKTTHTEERSVHAKSVAIFDSDRKK